MPGLIPENILEDILSRIDIVELISGYLPLKKAGRNFKTNCPFHHEKTPSFMVSPDKQIYHCFGCGESGNAFKFLMRYERMDFPEAAELLAKKSGVILPKTEKTDDKTESLITQLYKVNELATSFYETCLHGANGITARNYLIKRGITQETAKTFKLGVAPGTWDALIAHLRDKSMALSFIEKAGLIIPKDGGGFYDRFRNRVIFPIFDIKSRPIAFGARVLDDSLPKYVNSPETPVYTKGKNLFGLNLAKDSIKDLDYAVIVEGYLDLIIPFQAGVRNIVASQGTALTLEQVKLIKRYTQNVVVVYDGDAAGELATLRSLDIFIEEEMQVRIVSLPQGFDPDTFVRKFGIDSFKENISQASGLFEYKLKVLKSRFNAASIEGKTKISTAMLETIAKIKNAVLKSEYLKKLAQELDIREDALLQETNKIKPDSLRSSVRQEPISKAIKINPTEKLLIKLMLEEGSFIERIREHLEPADFQDERACRIVSVVFDLAAEGKEVQPNFLMNYLGQEDFSQIIGESLFMPDDLSSEHKEKVVDDCINRLKQERLKSRKQNLHNQIKNAQAIGDENALTRLMEEFHGLIKKR